MLILCALLLMYVVSVRLCVLWERPSEGWYKLNTDAAVDRAGGFWCSDS